MKGFEEAKALLRKARPVARRVLGEGNDITLSLRTNYARALHTDDGATIDDLREAVSTLEDTEQTARRVLGSAHPITAEIESQLKKSQAVLRERETQSSSPGSA